MEAVWFAETSCCFRATRHYNKQGPTLLAYPSAQAIHKLRIKHFEHFVENFKSLSEDKLTIYK
jgi:hypothetical protein